MDKENNIDSLLQLLKDSYSEESTSDKKEEPSLTTSEVDDISNEALQEKLRDRFVETDTTKENNDPERDEFTYTIDDSFFEEAETEDSLEEIAEHLEEPQSEAFEEDDEPPFDIILDEDEDDMVLEVVESENDAEDVEQIDDSLNYRQDSENEAFSFFDEDFTEEIQEEIEESEEELENDQTEAEEGFFLENENGDIVFVDSNGEILEETPADDTDFDVEEPSAETIEDAPLDIGVPPKFKTLITGYDASEEKYEKYVEPVQEIAEEMASENSNTPEAEAQEGIDLGEYFSEADGQLAMFETTSDDWESEGESNITEEAIPDEKDVQIALDFDSAEETRINRVISDEPISEIDDGMLALLLEVEDRKVIEDSVGEENMERFMSGSHKDGADHIDPAESFAFDGAEYESYEQSEEFFDAYSKEKTFTLMRVIGCGFFTALIFILELLRFIGVEFEGLLDYTIYPFIYSVISIQLLILSALFAWRELLRGFKRAFAYNVSNWSAVSIVFGFTVLYGLISAFMDVEYTSYTFCSIASLYILFGLVTEYISVCREMKSFRIYASDKNKFTLNTDAKNIQAAEKMHRGGISEKSKIFEPADIKFPKGYFSAVNCDRAFEKTLRGSPSIIIALSALVLLANAILGASAQTSIAMFMITLCALAPISSLAYHTFPMYKLTSKLYTREIAVAGEAMAQKYAQCEYIVLSDMHLFKRAQPQKNGIFIFDKDKSTLTIEYLDALYSAIGGPMRDMFSSGEPSKHTVKLRRVARDGVEAAIDGKHSVILGNVEFLTRYGISMGDMTPTKRGEGLLGFAVDGTPAAKLCLRYETEALFETLAKRLAENGIGCAIETYDPIISSKYAAECRGKDAVPINVIHKNADDYYSSSKLYRKETTGMLVCSSRLKLVEALIWCKRISKIWKICSICQVVMYALALSVMALASALEMTEYVNQYTAFILQIIAMLPMLIAMLSQFPDSEYFSIETDAIKDTTK